MTPVTGSVCQRTRSEEAMTTQRTKVEHHFGFVLRDIAAGETAEQSLNNLRLSFKVLRAGVFTASFVISVASLAWLMGTALKENQGKGVDRLDAAAPNAPSVEGDRSRTGSLSSGAHT